MLKACSKCGKIHDDKYECTKRTYYKRTEEDKLRNTNDWHKKSKEIKEKSNYLCAICRENNRFTYDSLEVHHIDKLREEPDKLLDDYNLICLCSKHHKEADAGLISKEHLRELAKAREDNTPPLAF